MLMMFIFRAKIHTISNKYRHISFVGKEVSLRVTIIRLNKTAGHEGGTEMERESK
jgi:hypothetical protein